MSSEKIIVKPSHIQDGGLWDSEWQNTEKEVIARNIVFLSQEIDDVWLEFTWKEYEEMCTHCVSGSEKGVLDDFVEDGYLSRKGAVYKVTGKFIKALFKFIKPELLAIESARRKKTNL